MIYRKLDTNGDYTFGLAAGNFFNNSPAAVVQAINTRLKLIQGEWFLDTSIGVPYDAKILGMGRLATYNAAINEVILNTPGVNSIVSYSSGYNPETRKAAVSCTVDTIYGTSNISAVYAYASSSGNQLDINFILDSSIMG